MVWIVRNGYRYFEGKSEYEINRMLRIRNNRNDMVKSKLIEENDPFPNMSREAWDIYLSTIGRFEEALKRFELGVEDYEIVEEDSSPPEADCFPSPSKKLKVKHKVRHTRDLNLTLEKKDFGQKKVVHSTKRKVITKRLSRKIKDLMSGDLPVLHGPDLPVDIAEIEEEESEDVMAAFDLLNNCDHLTPEQLKAQLKGMIKEAKKTIIISDDDEEEECSLTQDTALQDPETSGHSSTENIVQSERLQEVVVPLSEQSTDKTSTPAPESPGDFDWLAKLTPGNMLQEVLVPLPVPEQPPMKASTPAPASPGDFDWLAKLTPDGNGDFIIRKSPEPGHASSTEPGLLTSPEVDPVDEPVVFMMPPKHDYPVKPNLDYVQSPPPNQDQSPDPPATAVIIDMIYPDTETTLEVKSTQNKKNTQKRGSQCKKNNKRTDKPSNVIKSKTTELLESKTSVSTEDKKTVPVEESSVLVVENNIVEKRQSARLVDKVVNYAEVEIPEDVHFWCWRCKDDVVNECELHGKLIPCPEIITKPGTKNPLTFPRPSFIEIRKSEIRDAGYGAFATHFIKPGVILGQYKGKVVKRKDYLKIKESGYAWEVTDREGNVSYIDGAGHRASNWLKFVNCCRGEVEQNTISRMIQGQIEYYSYKPIAVGQELKIYYGLKYFTDLGYDPTPDKDNKGDVYCCSKCNKQYTDKQYLDKHKCMSNKHFKCTQCDKMYSTKYSLTEHIKSVHLGQGHQCEQCNYKTASKDMLKRHISSIHEGEEKFNCPFCYYRTNIKFHLTRHINTHTKTKPHKCPHCEASFIQAGELAKHISGQHTNKKYPCQYNCCSVKCDNEEALMSHYQTHPKRRFQCSECPMSFDQKVHLSHHTAIHSGEKRFQCEYCDKRFTTSDSLTRHILTHTGVKNFKCDNCGKCFTQKFNLTRHMKSEVCTVY